MVSCTGCRSAEATIRPQVNLSSWRKGRCSPFTDVCSRGHPHLAVSFVNLISWFRIVCDEISKAMELFPTLAPFLVFSLIPTSSCFYLPEQRKPGERSDTQFCMTENNVSLGNLRKTPNKRFPPPGVQNGGEWQQEWELAARVRQHEHGRLLREVPARGGLHHLDMVEQHRRLPALVEM